MKHKILFFLFLYLFIQIQVKGQKIYKEAKIDSLAQLSIEQLKEFFDAGNDMNEILYSEREDDSNISTVYTELAHSYGFYCEDEAKELIYYILKNSKEPIKNPLFFFTDACSERRTDILEYFKLLHDYQHEVTENNFRKLYSLYYNDINYINEVGKTALMYACEFDYINMIKKIIKEGANIKTKDPKGKQAIDYCITKKARKIVNKAKK